MPARVSIVTTAPRAPLSRERVLGAAMALADAEGLAAVTMRRLAADLGVEAMSLYHHIPNKEALLDGLAQAVLEEINHVIGSQAAVEDDWRTAVRKRSLSAREVMVRHRWAPGLLGTRATMPPGMYPYFEELLATMVRGGLSYHLAHQGLHALGTMALGFTSELFAPADEGGSMDEEAAEAELAAMAEALPHLAAMVAAEVHDNAEDPLGWCDSQSEFEFTLGLILDGLARATGGTNA